MTTYLQSQYEKARMKSSAVVDLRIGIKFPCYSDVCIERQRLLVCAEASTLVTYVLMLKNTFSKCQTAVRPPPLASRPARNPTKPNRYHF